MISASRPTADIAALSRANWNDETTVLAPSIRRRVAVQGPAASIAETTSARR